MTQGLLSGDALDVRPHVSNPAGLKIGIIGSGDIVENSHIPSYQAAGFSIAGIASRSVESAERVASSRHLDRAYSSIDELLNDESIDVVDIAVPPDFQPDIALAAISAGKHVLAQKPLALTMQAASTMVDAADEAGLRLAVNQNGRYDPSINATRSLVTRGALGERLVASMAMSIIVPWQEYYQEERYSELVLLLMSVHHIDQMRWVFGEPNAVTAVHRCTPGGYHGETIAQYILAYDDGFWASSLDDATNWSTDFGITYRVQGTEMCLAGEIGWPRGTYSTLRSQQRGSTEWKQYEFSRQWFPDAFSATMGELLSALEEGREPSNSGRDNLATMRLVFAAYESAREGRTVAIPSANGSDEHSGM